MAELGEIACVGNDVQFQAFADGEMYIFIIPKEAVMDLLQEGQTFDCAQFVLDNTELFEELAEDYLNEFPSREPMVITIDTLRRYFYS